MPFTNTFSPIIYFKMATAHSPVIVLFISIAFIIFIVAAILSINKKANRAASIIKFAPSVMTSLGLLGTFVALTDSLTKLQLNNLGNISDESLSTFIKSLESVFSFSILGIGSAIFFMAINFIILASRNGHLAAQKLKNQSNIQSRQAQIDEINRSTLDELKNQNRQLESLADISNQASSQNEQLNEMKAFIKAQLDIQSNQNAKQQERFDALNKSLGQISLALSSMDFDYDVDKLGIIIAQNINDLLTPPLIGVTKALEKNNSHLLQDFFIELKNEVLIPIRNEINIANSATMKVVKAVQDNQETNTKLIGGLNNISDQMAGFITTTDPLVKSIETAVKDMQILHGEQKASFIDFNAGLKDNLDSIQPAIENGMKKAEVSLTDAITTTTTAMSGALESGITEISATIGKMQTLQEHQDNTLEKFNAGLKDNLDSIQPAIENGMKKAEVSLTTAIDNVTQKMNTAMADVIKKISNDVVQTLNQVLIDFDANMSRHLTQMNVELEATGQRSSKLIDQSAITLRNTLSSIDKTLEASSQKLQTELKEFRETYQLSLNSFFEQQNKALEKTLGVQNKQLQKTANQLGEQFDEMKNAQAALNKDTQETIAKAKDIYDPLLLKITTIAQNLNQSQTHTAKELREMLSNIEDINNALMTLGKKLPNEFSKAFDLLNERYIERFNDSNTALQQMMNDMFSASAALLTAIKLNNQENQ